jgi:RimJ/RimL family protein N-acetyltransferase
MIETTRLRLRDYREEDREVFAALNADPAVARWLGGVPDREASDFMFDRLHAHIAALGFGFWVVERKADGRFLGLVGLQTIPPGSLLPVAPAVEIGWRLIPEAWGQGYASEAAAEALAWAFAHLDLDEVVSLTATENLRSQAVMRRIGMVRAPSRDFDHPDLALDDPLLAHVVWVARRTDWRAPPTSRC